MVFKVGHKPEHVKQPMSAELAAIRVRPNSEVRRLLNLILDLPMCQLILKAENPKTPALDLIITKVILKAIETSDYRIASFILDRLVGPVKISEPDHGAVRAQLKAEIELESMAIEDVRALAAKRGTVIDAE